MTLLEHYLRAVRMYLPRQAQRQDILDELADLFQSKLDEREEELGRPLSEVEQQTVLIDHGNPTSVAARYGGTNLGLAFGRQIISPELFPRWWHVFLTGGLYWLIVVCWHAWLCLQRIRLSLRSLEVIA